MKNNETCNALKCLKPSGLIDWVNCRLRNGWVHSEYAKFSKPEAQSLSKFACCRCALVNTIRQCHGDNFGPDTLFNSSVVHLERVPKNARIPLAENLILKTNDICETASNSALWCLLLSSLSCCLGTRGGKGKGSSLKSIMNNCIRDGVVEKKPKRDRKPQQKRELNRRLRFIHTKLDEGIVAAGIIIAIGDDKLAYSTVDNYTTIKLKHPQRKTSSVPDPTDIDCFSTSEFLVHKVVMSFPNGSGLDGISAQILKDLTSKSNWQTGLKILRALTNLVNVIFE